MGKKTRRKRPGFMILKGCELERKFGESGRTVRSFADVMDIEMGEAYRILSSEACGLEIARRFITRCGADFACEYIDWGAMGIKDPLKKSKKRKIITRHYDSNTTDKKLGGNIAQ
jgi:hypothetical protein